MLRASIVVIGDELLAGHVQDTNSHWVAGRLHANAVPLDRVHVVPDTHDAIDEALTAELARARPRVVVTTGGIGSTPDDVTFEAVAASLGLALVEQPDLRERMEGALAWTAAQGLDVDEAFRDAFLRMARVPAGSRLLDTPGWAPAVALDVDGGSDGGGATVVVLPGVPGMVRQLVRDGVEPQLLADRNDPWHVVVLEHAYPESVLNPTFATLGREHPDVKLGSYPGRPNLVRLTGVHDEVEAAAEVVRADLAALDGSAAGRRIQSAWAERLAEDD